jgi:hypothetical protein
MKIHCLLSSLQRQNIFRGQLSTKIYDKRDDFNFKIINFPNMCSNIPASPAYGVYISQLIRYAMASSNYSDFLKRHLYLRNRLLGQGYKKIRLQIRGISLKMMRTKLHLWSIILIVLQDNKGRLRSPRYAWWRTGEQRSAKVTTLCMMENRITKVG